MSSLQIRGAMGYTREHGLHLYLRGALSSGLVLGTPADRRSWLVQALGL
jgi:alkylation response protein AidB-like acyl-CoA dehydrogenase